MIALGSDGDIGRIIGNDEGGGGTLGNTLGIRTSADDVAAGRYAPMQSSVPPLSSISIIAFT